MTVAQFKKWLESRVHYLRGLPDYQEQEDHAYGLELLEEAYQIAIDLNLPECVAACKNGPATVRLLECLNAIPESKTVHTPPEIAEQLVVAPETVVGWIKSGQLKASNVAKPGKRPRWKVQRDDLEEFLAKRQPDKKPDKKRKPQPLVKRY